MYNFFKGFSGAFSLHSTFHSEGPVLYYPCLISQAIFGGICLCLFNFFSSNFAFLSLAFLHYCLFSLFSLRSIFISRSLVGFCKQSFKKAINR